MTDEREPDIIDDQPGHDRRAPRLEPKTQDTAQEILHQLIETYGDTYRVEVTPTAPGDPGNRLSSVRADPSVRRLQYVRSGVRPAGGVRRDFHELIVCIDDGRYAEILENYADLAECYDVGRGGQLDHGGGCIGPSNW